MKRHRIKTEKPEHSKSSHTKEEVRDLAYYIHDRVELMHQVFSLVKPKELKAIAPDSVRNLPVDDLEELCLEELLGISSKRLCAILDGADPPSDTDSSSSSHQDQLETISLDSISSDEVQLSPEHNDNRKKNRKGHCKRRSKHNDKRNNHSGNDNSDAEEAGRNPSSAGAGKKKEQEARGAGMTVLELLELQARARAIRAQLAADQVHKSNDTATAEPAIGIVVEDDEVEIKEEHPEVVELSSDEEKPDLKALEQRLRDKRALQAPERHGSKEKQTERNVTNTNDNLTIVVPQKQARKIVLHRKRSSAKGQQECQAKDNNINDKSSNAQEKSSDLVADKVDVTNKNNFVKPKEKGKKKIKENKTKKKKKDDENDVNDHYEITLQLSDREKMDLLEDFDRKDYDNVSGPDTVDSDDSSSETGSDISLRDVDNGVANSNDGRIGITDHNNIHNTEHNSASTLSLHNARTGNEDEINNNASDPHDARQEIIPNLEVNNVPEDDVISSQSNQEVARDQDEVTIENVQKNTVENEVLGARNHPNKDEEIDSEDQRVHLSEHESVNSVDIPEYNSEVEKQVTDLGNDKKNNPAGDMSEKTSMCIPGSSKIDKKNKKKEKKAKKDKRKKDAKQNFRESADENFYKDNESASIAKDLGAERLHKDCGIIKYPQDTDGVDQGVNSNEIVQESVIESISSNVIAVSVLDGKVQSVNEDKNESVLEPINNTGDKVHSSNKNQNENLTNDKKSNRSDGDISEKECSDVEAFDVRPEVVCISSSDTEESSEITKRNKKKEKKMKKDKKKKDNKQNFREAADENFYKDERNSNITENSKADELTDEVDQKQAESNDAHPVYISVDSDNDCEIFELSDGSSCYEVEGVTVLSKEPTSDEIEALSAKIDDEIEREDIVTEEEMKKQSHATGDSVERTEESVENISWKDRYLGSKKVIRVLTTASILNAIRKKNKELKHKLDECKTKEAVVDKELVPPEKAEMVEEGSIMHYNILEGSTKYVDPVKEPKVGEETAEGRTNVTKEMEKDAKQLLKMYKRLLKYNDMAKTKDPNKSKKKKNKKKKEKVVSRSELPST